METREQTEQALAHARVVRGELDEHLRAAQERVQVHLSSVAGVCMSELQHMVHGEPLADGNIDDAWEHLQNAIEHLRGVEANIKAQDYNIESMVQDLADDEIWK